jgi:hypothetical protein
MFKIKNMFQNVPRVRGRIIFTQLPALTFFKKNNGAKHGYILKRVKVKGKDKKYHVMGELRVATRDQINSLMKTIRPLVDVKPGVTKVIVLLVPWYCCSKCCDDASHVTNFGKDLVAEVRSGLSAVKKAVRTYLFKEKYVDIRLIDPSVVIKDIGSGTFADPVHLTKDGYDQMAGHVVSVLLGVGEGDMPADPTSNTNQNQRIRILSMGSVRGSATRGRGGWQE